MVWSFPFRRAEVGRAATESLFSWWWSVVWARQAGGRAHEVGPIFGQCAGEFARESFFGLKCLQNGSMIKSGGRKCKSGPEPPLCPSWHTWLFLAATWSALIEKWSRHDYFLRRPKAGRLSSKSVPLSLSAARWAGVPKVAPEPSPWPVGVLVVAPMGWCSKSWGGVPKSCPRIPTLSKLTHMIISCRDLRLVALVFQKVAPEPPPWPVGVLVVALMGWCSKSCGVFQKVVPEPLLCILLANLSTK